MKEVDKETIKRFEDKNFEYRQPFFARIYEKYYKYFACGYIIGMLLQIIILPLFSIPPFFSQAFEDFFIEFSVESGNSFNTTDFLIPFFFIIVGLVMSIYFFISGIFFFLMYSKDIIKINQNGIFYKDFYNRENLITWEDFENVKQTFINFIGAKSCVIILKNKNVFRRYIAFNIQREFVSFWSKEIDEVCKFIKFKIMQTNEKKSEK